MPRLFCIALAILICSLRLFAQDGAKPRMTGVIVDSTGAVVPGFTLNIDTQYGGFTDINGEFSMEVPPSRFVLTSGQATPDDFRVFLNFESVALIPDFLRLRVGGVLKCTSHSNYGSDPAILKSSLPAYPPAAQAVRAVGEVSVELSLGPDGKVISAHAISGHPLLKKSSEVAAEKIEFESDTRPERTVVITYVYLMPAKKKEGLDRYSCPYRPIVEPPDTTVDYSRDTSSYSHPPAMFSPLVDQLSSHP